MTAILHISDTHLGKKQYGSDLRVDDFSKAFDTSIDIAIDNGVDAVIHTGDLFDDRSPNTKEISDAFDSIKRLEEEDIPFLGIVGNHERKWDRQWLDIFQTLDNVHRLSRTPYIINDDIAIYGFDSMRDAEWEDEKFDIKAPQDDDVHICLCMHELFTELMSPVKADRSVKTVIDNINIKPDVIALGDYHASVGTEIDGVKVFYAGATERTSAKTGDPTVRIIMTEEDSISTEWRKINGTRDDVPRPFYAVDIEFTESTDKTDISRRIQEDVKNIDEAVVVVNITGNQKSSLSPNDVYKVLDRTGVPIPYVSDKRKTNRNTYSTEAIDTGSIDIEERIQSELSDLDLSEEIRRIESKIVRNSRVNKSNIRDKVDAEFKDGDDI